MRTNDPKPARCSLPTRLVAPALIVILTAGLAHGATRTPGTLEGTIGDASLALQGVCSQTDGIFEFWSDGEEFAVNWDANGDGLYLNIMVRSLDSRTVAILLYSRNGEMVFNGVFDYEQFDGRSIEADTTLGADPGTPAAFQVRCQ